MCGYLPPEEWVMLLAFDAVFTAQPLSCEQAARLLHCVCMFQVWEVWAPEGHAVPAGRVQRHGCAGRVGGRRARRA
eukprot:274826-Chlamydomonas_euryale.AAC.1